MDETGMMSDKERDIATYAIIQSVVKSIVSTMEDKGMKSISRYELTKIFARTRFE